MKILIVGDTHGDIKLIYEAIDYAEEMGCKEIYQVGDFGFFPNLYPDFLANLNSPIPFYFIDGNHDDHSVLKRYRHENSPISLEDMGYDSYNFYYIPRGYMKLVGSSNIMFIGGANSTDRRYRKEGIDWWREETIDFSEYYRCIGNVSSCKVDIILSHEGIRSEVIAYEEKDNCREAIEQLVMLAKPCLLIHGHHHISYMTNINGTCVKGLGCTSRSMYEVLVV